MGKYTTKAGKWYKARFIVASIVRFKTADKRLITEIKFKTCFVSHLYSVITTKIEEIVL